MFVKSVFAQAAQGANPIFRQIGEAGARIYTVVGVTFYGIINITTRAFVFFLLKNLLKLLDI